MTSFWQGILFGVAVILPGLSGGTAALITGSYRELIGSLAGLRWRYLLPLAAGAALGVFLGAKLLELFWGVYPNVILSFLLGLLLASGIDVLRRVPGFGWTEVAAAITGLGLVLALSRVEAALPWVGEGSLSYLRLIIGGAASSSVMLLPGVSGSSLLILLGQYRTILEAINELQWTVLGAFGVGSVIGLFGFSRLLGQLLERFPAVTLSTLGGLVLGSVWLVLPTEFALSEAGALAIGLGLGAIPIWIKR
ncbi:MAG: DUF368 domain-containing protein [Bacillota bacterium]